MCKADAHAEVSWAQLPLAFGATPLPSHTGKPWDRWVTPK